jgi:hypothetical protein
MRYLNLDMDATLGGQNASDEVISSQKAIKTYVDNSIKDNISEMEDVNITNLSDGQVLIYDSESEKWINKYKPSAIIRDWKE